jgi:hypothetical protein
MGLWKTSARRVDDWHGKKTSGHHRRSLVETHMFRLKTILGGQTAWAEVCQSADGGQNHGQHSQYHGAAWDA